MTEKCPYCYRNIGTWNHDPILLPNGSKYFFSSETVLSEVTDIKNRQYKGLTVLLEADIQAMQDALKTLEEANIAEVDRTNFTSLTINHIFQVRGQHIYEMRQSVEKLLAALGLTKVDFFNYDEDGNHITSPIADKVEWTDPITEATDLTTFQVKWIHIEDLRHKLAETGWVEDWAITPNQVWWGDAGAFHLTSDFEGDMADWTNYCDSAGFGSPGNQSPVVGTTHGKIEGTIISYGVNATLTGKFYPSNSRWICYGSGSLLDTTYHHLVINPNQFVKKGGNLKTPIIHFASSGSASISDGLPSFPPSSQKQLWSWIAIRVVIEFNNGYWYQLDFYKGASCNGNYYPYETHSPFQSASANRYETDLNNLTVDLNSIASGLPGYAGATDIQITGVTWGVNALMSVRHIATLPATASESYSVQGELAVDKIWFS